MSSLGELVAAKVKENEEEKLKQETFKEMVLRVAMETPVDADESGPTNGYLIDFATRIRDELEAGKEDVSSS